MTDSTETSGIDPQRADRFRIGEWQVEPGLHQLTGAVGTRKLEPRVMDLLVFLACHAGRTVTRERLVAEVWHGAAVIDAAITRAVSALRSALGDDAQSPRYIRTVPRRGYQLIADVGPATPTIRPDNGVPPATSDRRGAGWIATGVGVLLVLFAAAVVLGRLEQPRRGTLASDSLAVAPQEVIDSIAVLPLDGDESASRQDYFAQGMTEALSTDLAKVPALRVIAPTSVRKLRTLTPTEIGRRLDVDAVLHGSVREDGQAVLLNLQLLRTTNGEVLWAESYHQSIGEIFALQWKITRDVIRHIEIELADREGRHVASGEAIDPQAFHHYLKGRYFWSRRTAESLIRSREHFEAAVALEPRYALAWAGLADALLQLVNYDVLRSLQALPIALDAAERAVMLGPNEPEGYSALGLAKLHGSWDLEGAEAAYRTAIALGPAYANVRQFLAELLSITGRHEEALQEIELAWRLDPLSPVIHGVWGLVLHGAGRFEEMLEKSAESLRLDPSMRWLYRYRAYALERLGRIPEATDEVEKLAIQSPERTAALRAALDAEGLAAYYSWELEAYARAYRKPTLIAEAHAGLGQDEQALVWIERAMVERGEYFLHLYRSPAFDRLRADPRLGPRLAALGLEIPWLPSSTRPHPAGHGTPR